MTPELEARLEALEVQLAADPGSESLREEILFEYLGPELAGAPRRIHHAIEYVRRFPRTPIARSPLVHVDQLTFPAAFAQLEQEWLRLREEYPGDPELTQGLAALVAPCDRGRAASVLDEALEERPEHPGLWLELGRICAEPKRRLAALQKGRALGASQPNLLTWLALAAIEAGDEIVAEQMAAELLALVKEARAVHGETLDWPERGRDLWARARSGADSNATARTLVLAIADQAHRKHWVHTTLGVIAARRGNVAEAREHLHESAALNTDYRLSSYGPSLLLARELCTLGEWNAVADYLEACAAFWNPERLRGWVQQLRERQMPDFLQQ